MDDRRLSLGVREGGFESEGSALGVEVVGWSLGFSDGSALGCTDGTGDG